MNLIVPEYKTFMVTGKPVRRRLQRRILVDMPGDFKIRKPDDIKTLMTSFNIAINLNTVEHTYLICLDGTAAPKGIFLISKGTVDRSAISPRDVIIAAMTLNCCNCILVHNHTFGTATPSESDISFTTQTVKAMDACDMSLLDHCIVDTDGNLTSMRTTVPQCWEQCWQD